MLVCCGGLRGVFGSALRVSFAHGGCGARAVSLASQKSEARGEWRSERSERAKLTSPPAKARRERARVSALSTHKRVARSA